MYKTTKLNIYKPIISHLFKKKKNLFQRFKFQTNKQHKNKNIE